jgi:hypothetical protein
MIRGTTPTITYNFPFAASGISKIRIYFMQGTETLLTKTESDCTFSGQSVSVTLTQQETYGFSAKKRVETKSRFKLSSGTVGGTKSKFIDVEETGGEREILV